MIISVVLLSRPHATNCRGHGSLSVSQNFLGKGGKGMGIHDAEPSSGSLGFFGARFQNVCPVSLTARRDCRAALATPALPCNARGPQRPCQRRECRPRGPSEQWDPGADLCNGVQEHRAIRNERYCFQRFQLSNQLSQGVSEGRRARYGIHLHCPKIMESSVVYSNLRRLIICRQSSHGRPFSFPAHRLGQRRSARSWRC